MQPRGYSQRQCRDDQPVPPWGLAAIREVIPSLSRNVWMARVDHNTQEGKPMGRVL